MSGEPETFRQTKSRLPLFKATGTLPVVPSNGSTYSKAEARDEAARCTQCDCNICRDGCEMLKSMNLSARKVEQDVRLSAGTAQGLFDRVGSRMIYSCDLCGHCGSICPQGISLDGILEDGKTTLFADGHFAPALHDFYRKR